MPTPDSGALHPELPSLGQYASNERLTWSSAIDRDYWNVLVYERVLASDWWRVGVPACLFVVQSNLQYLAARNLSVVVFQLAYQLKIPATAICSVALLGKSLSIQQWLSLVALSLGVGLVQLGSSSAGTADVSATTDATLGMLAVVLACSSSGFASTYFERMLKSAPSGAASGRDDVSLWIRNIQLSLFGLIIALPISFYQLSRSNESIGTSTIAHFFIGFDDALAWTVIFFQAVGGLLGALVMQHADNVSKCFATSLSVLLSFVVSVSVLRDERIEEQGRSVSWMVLVGAAMVLGSTWVYATTGTRWRSLLPSR